MGNLTKELEEFVDSKVGDARKRNQILQSENERLEIEIKQKKQDIDNYVLNERKKVNDYATKRKHDLDNLEDSLRSREEDIVSREASQKNLAEEWQKLSDAKKEFEIEKLGVEEAKKNYMEQQHKLKLAEEQLTKKIEELNAKT